MTHYYSRESKTAKGNFTIMEVLGTGRERLVARTPRGDVAAHLVTQLNISPLPVPTPPVVPWKFGDVITFNDSSSRYLLSKNTAGNLVLVDMSDGRHYHYASIPTPQAYQKIAGEHAQVETK